MFKASKFQLVAMMAGYVQNATGFKLYGFNAEDLAVTHDDEPYWRA